VPYYWWLEPPNLERGIAAMQIRGGWANIRCDHTIAVLEPSEGGDVPAAAMPQYLQDSAPSDIRKKGEKIR